MSEVEKKLFEHIRDAYDIGNDPEYTADINLFDYGFVDSLGAIEIMSFIENEWGVEISQKDLTLYPMNSVNEIASVVQNKMV